ncbi:MAG TPA: hypothetical protein VFC92_04455 [Bacteroidales bacterium]|nr:hypothetical protein [Bacteroidales bacterium]
MSNYLYTADINNPKAKVKVNLFLIHFQDENKVHFVFSPHLDLTGYGYTLKDAKKSFTIVLDDFIDYTLNKKTISKVLADLGWKSKGTAKKPARLIAPSITSVIGKNKYVSEIFDKHAVQTFHQEVELPVMV